MIDKMTIANMDTTMHVHAFVADTTGFMMSALIGELEDAVASTWEDRNRGG